MALEEISPLHLEYAPIDDTTYFYIMLIQLNIRVRDLYRLTINI